MIDVFFCTASPDPIRVAMAATCVERWAEEPGVDIAGLSPGRCRCSAREFQRTRRVWAEQMARSPIYVIADDDSLLPKEPIVAHMLRLMEQYPQFAMLSVLPSNAHIERWTEKPDAYWDAEIMEHVSVGQVRFCRKGIVKDWPPMGAGPGYDLIHAEAIRRSGFRVGYARNIMATHLGEGHSTIWGNPVSV